MTPNFLEYFDRLKQGDYQLLQHLEAHGHLNGFSHERKLHCRGIHRGVGDCTPGTLRTQGASYV